MSRLSALTRVREFIAKNPKSTAAAAAGALAGLGGLTFLGSEDEKPKPPTLPAPQPDMPPYKPPAGSATDAGPVGTGKTSMDEIIKLYKYLDERRPGPAGTGKMNMDETLKLYKYLEESGERATRRDVEAQLILQKATEDIGIKKTLEQSRRQIELENIKAWRDITAKQYEANAAIGLGMAEIAYRATQPNPGVLAATQAFARTGMEAFNKGI